jgi:hypothetical protein
MRRPSDSKKTKTPKQKVQTIAAIFRKELEAYELAEPQWFRITLLKLVRDCLDNLRRYIDSPGAPETNWNNPRVLVNYGIQW